MSLNNIITQDEKVTQDERDAIEEAVLKKKVLKNGNKRCKLVSVDFKKNEVTCLPLNTVPIQEILDNQYELEGGSKSRKHLSRKRKGKKSYKKKKYGKSKKSRRFRRSIRSRR